MLVYWVCYVHKLVMERSSWLVGSLTSVLAQDVRLHRSCNLGITSQTMGHCTLLSSVMRDCVRMSAAYNLGIYVAVGGFYMA